MGFMLDYTCTKGRKSKVYFHTSYNQLPNNSVVKDVINKLADIITTNRMHFGFLVEDHPVCVLITVLKAENPNKYSDIVPFLCPFHTQCVMMNTIYKRYKGIELWEVLVAAAVIAEGSVDPSTERQALQERTALFEAHVRGHHESTVEGKTSDADIS